MDIIRPAAGDEISPDSPGNIRVRILHFRAHKAHPGTSLHGADRPRFSSKQELKTYGIAPAANRHNNGFATFCTRVNAERMDTTFWNGPLALR
jgi:hypothetical protein